MKTAYKFRLYPNKQEEDMLDLVLETCRHLYNLALADRKNAYEVEGISRSYEDQAVMLTAEKKNGNFKGIFSQVLQEPRGRRQDQDMYHQERQAWILVCYLGN